MLLLLLLSRFSHVQTLYDPIDGSPSGSPVPGILQARTLEWVAISFSNAWKWKVKVKSLSRVRLLATPWTAAYQAPPPWDFPGTSTGVECHCLLRFPSIWPHNFFFIFNFTILYWFCHISTSIRHRYTRVPHPEPPSLLPPCTIPLGRLLYRVK